MAFRKNFRGKKLRQLRKKIKSKLSQKGNGLNVMMRWKFYKTEILKLKNSENIIFKSI